MNRLSNAKFERCYLSTVKTEVLSNTTCAHPQYLKTGCRTVCLCPTTMMHGRNKKVHCHQSRVSAQKAERGWKTTSWHPELLFSNRSLAYVCYDYNRAYCWYSPRKFGSGRIHPGSWYSPIKKLAMQPWPSARADREEYIVLCYSALDCCEPVMSIFKIKMHMQDSLLKCMWVWWYGIAASMVL